MTPRLQPYAPDMGDPEEDEDEDEFDEDDEEDEDDEDDEEEEEEEEEWRVRPAAPCEDQAIRSGRLLTSRPDIPTLGRISSSA
jgi:hypothetical protein